MISAFLSLAFGRLFKALGAAFDFLRTVRPSTLIIASLIILAGLQWHFGKGVAKDRDAKAHGWAMERVKVDVHRAAHRQTVANYKKARREFEKQQEDNLKRTRDRYERNAQIAEYAKAAIDADWRARFDRLRSRRSEVRVSGASGTQMPAVPAPSNGPTQPDHGPGRPDTVAVRIDHLEHLVSGVLQGEAIRALWIANEDVETSNPIP